MIDKISLGFYISTCCITSKKQIVTGTEAEPGKHKGSNRISFKRVERHELNILFHYFKRERKISILFLVTYIFILLKGNRWWKQLCLYSKLNGFCLKLNQVRCKQNNQRNLCCFIPFTLNSFQNINLLCRLAQK